MTQYFGEPIFGDAVFGTNAENLERIVTSPVGMTDSNVRVQTAARTQTDAEGMTDAQVQTTSSARVMADAEGVSDPRTQTLSAQRTHTDRSSVRHQAADAGNLFPPFSDPRWRFFGGATYDAATGDAVIAGEGQGVEWTADIPPSTSMYFGAEYFATADTSANFAAGGVFAGSAYYDGQGNPVANSTAPPGPYTGNGYASEYPLNVWTRLDSAFELGPGISNVVFGWQGTTAWGTHFRIRRPMMTVAPSSTQTANPFQDYGIVQDTLSSVRVLTDAEGVRDSHLVYQTYVALIQDFSNLTDSNFTTQTFRLTITDAVGIVDANERQVNSTRFSTDPINATDTLFVALTYVTFIQNVVGGSDPPPTRVVDAQRAHTDTTGSTDTLLGAESYFRENTDPVGLLDAIVVQLSYPRVVSDPMGVRDDATRQVSLFREHLDGTPISSPDSANGRDFEREANNGPDEVGLTDTAIYFLRNDGVPQDLTVVDDDLVRTLSATQSKTEALGLLDGVMVVQAANPRPVSPMGLADTADRWGDTFREGTDAVGLTDTPERAIAHIREVTSTVGVADDGQQEHIGRPFIFDVVAGADTHGQGGDLSRELTEQLGLADATAKTQRTLLADFSNVIDGNPVQTLDVPRALTDGVGVRDALQDLGRDHQRTITDDAGLAEVFERDFDRDGRLQEVTGVTDSLEVTLTKELTEDVAVLEPGFGTVTDYAVVITEQVLLREEVYRTPQGPDTGNAVAQQIFGGAIFGDPVFGNGLASAVVDSAGLSDALLVRQSTSRQPVEPIRLLDPTSQAVAHVRQVTDAVGTTDTPTVELQRRDLDDAGLSDSVEYLKFRLAEPTDVQNGLDTLEQASGASRRPTDDAGLRDPLAPAHGAFREATDPVGVTDSVAITRRYEIADRVGVTDDEQQRFTHARVIQDAVAGTDLEVDLFGARPMVVEPVGVRDSLVVELIPPGLVRYGHLRPVFAGKPYVWSIQARKVGVHSTRAALEVRWHNTNLQEFARSGAQPIDLDSTEPRRIDVRVQAPPGAFYASLYFGQVDSTAGNEVDWDSAQFEQGEIPTAYGPKPDEILPGAVQSTMLALGAVTTDRVRAGAITNSLVAVGAIDTRTLATDAVDNRVLAAGSVNTEQLVVGSVVTGAIAAGAITADTIAANAITAGKIAADAIGAREIIANSITAAEVAANTLTANEIAANAITANELAAGSVYAGSIQANAITGDKITANTITGSHIEAGSVHANRLQAKTIAAEQIAAGAIVAETIAAGAIIAEKIAAGQILADKIAANAVTTEKLAALAVKADQIDSNAIRSHHVQADAIQAIHILAGSITADELSATAITGKIITGGIFQTGVQGEDRIVISAVDGNDQYGRNYRDVIQWRDASNRITGEIRGFLGDVGIYGIQLNSHVQLGHPDSVIYQYGRRSITQGRSKVRMGTTTGVCDGSGAWTAAIGPFSYQDASGNNRRFTPSVVVASMGDDFGTHYFGAFCVTTWDFEKVYGRVRYLTVTADGKAAWANPGAGTQFAIRYYAEIGA